MEYTLTRNEQFNSLEISFASIPDKAIREGLKALRFRWHSVKKIWYGYASEETLRELLEHGTITQAEAVQKMKKAKEKAKPVNKYGVKVGDVFCATWGYEQTQNDFFQVVEVVGSSMVRIVEVMPHYTATPTCGMAEDRKIEPINGKMLPRLTNSFSIEDNEKGDLHKIGNSGTEEEPYLYIKVTRDGVIRATPFNGGTVYESWYY